MTTKKKVCSVCKLPKNPKKDFNKNAHKKDGLQPACKECNRELCNKYYSKNKKKHRAAVAKHKRIYKEENRKFILDYFSSHPCVDCGETDARCLEFDHVRGKKTTNISFMLRNVCSIETIKKEIEKCDVRCANCHRKKTADDQGWYKTGS